MYLANGSSGSNVAKIQSALGIKADGIFGPQTKAAVTSYQQAHGLGVDGIVGNQTWGSLFSSPSTTTTPTLTPAITANPAPTTPTLTIPNIAPLKIDETNKPAAEVLPTTPDYVAYNPNLNMSDYITQAQQLLAPQLQSNENKINDQNIIDIKNANNDTLKRGIARGTYAGARVDTINTAKNRLLSDAQLNNDIQANSLASTNYNTAYDRGYNANKDLNANNWNTYSANKASADTLFNNAYNAYRADVGDQKDIYNANYDNAWKQYGANYTTNQDALTQANNTRDYNLKVTEDATAQSNADRNYALAVQEAAKKVSSSGGGGSSSGGATKTQKANYQTYIGSALDANANGNLGAWAQGIAADSGDDLTPEMRASLMNGGSIYKLILKGV